jgi:ABC-type transport system involved in cytochrome c biogenesis permease subunit
MLIGAGLAALALPARRKWVDVLAVLGMAAGFVVLTYGLYLRWQIAGRIPAANMFESLLFLSWGMGAFAILAMLFLRNRTVPLTASAMGALALILADCLPLDQYVRPIAPVLMDTVWMSIHVPVIMVSYSVLALGVLIAHVQLLVMAAAPARRQLCDAIDSIHYWYIHVGSILLLAGIVTGSMWAASSWGRYWGWDPKEVWSLVAFLGYLAIMHVRVSNERVPLWAYLVAAALGAAVFVLIIRQLAPLSLAEVLALAGTIAAMLYFTLTRGRFATAAKSILAFWLIVMTYVGVNYILGIGLHSYGFGTGAVARTMITVGVIDLAVVGLCGLAYVARGGPRFYRAAPAVAT